MERRVPVETCSVHKLHSPRNLTVEFHHVIPVAWQLHTLVANPPYPGIDPDGRGELWDNRGIWVCPTGHRNIHYWIVRMMHALLKANVTDPLVAYKSERPRVPPREFSAAYEALTRFLPESVPTGSLLQLALSGQYGQI